MNFPREVWNPKGAYRVVWGPEEHAQLKAEGWADQRPAEPEYASPLQEIADDIKAGVLPKRRCRPPKVQPISEVA